MGEIPTPGIAARRRGDRMKRREFITLLGCATAAWPFAARAQQTAKSVIGLLNQESTELAAHLVSGFHKGLSETGFSENKNLEIEYLWADGQYGLLPKLTADLPIRKFLLLAA